jgi:UDPglucose--hexose-1-phosphate uridylyltransferase
MSKDTFDPGHVRQEDERSIPELRRDPTSGNWALVQMPRKRDEEEKEATKKDAVALTMDASKKKSEEEKKKDRYKNFLAYLTRDNRQEFNQEACVWAKQFCGGKRQDKQALFGLRWSADGKNVEVTYRNWHADDWEVMVVRTDYAQVVPTQDSVLLGRDIFVAEAGAGIHDLIIDDPSEDHQPLGIMGEKRTQLVLMAMLYRLSGAIDGFDSLDPNIVGSPLRLESRVRHVAFFHNHRRESGGSLEHPHSQIIASPIIPTEVAAELEYVRRRHDQPPRRCVYCESIEDELALRDKDPQTSRILFETEHFLAVNPYCPTYPFETWIIPKRHAPSFSDIYTNPAKSGDSPTELEDLAAVVTAVICRLYVCLDDPGYNLLVKSQPIPPSDNPSKYGFYHWHIRIQPRGLENPAGFELSTGISHLPTPPEEISQALRSWGPLHKSVMQRGSLAWHISQAEKDLNGDLSAVGGARKLRNILTIVGSAASRLSNFSRGATLVKRIADERPELLISSRQQKLPDEASQRRQPDEHAGGEDGPHYRCCPATGRWVLIPGKARKRTVAKIVEANKKEKERQKKDQDLDKKRKEQAERSQKLPDSHLVQAASDRWVTVANEKWDKECELREKELQKEEPDCSDPEPERDLNTCPFCPKDPEALEKFVTSNELVGVVRDSTLKEERWENIKDDLNKYVYVINNYQPLFVTQESARKKLPRIGGTGPFKYVQGIGQCEVVVVGAAVVGTADKKEHAKVATEEQLTELLIAVRARLDAIKQLATDRTKGWATSPIRHVTVFSNHGKDAGAKGDHFNWQIIGSPIIPTIIERELDNCRSYAETYSGRCCFCDMIDAEIVQHQKYEEALRVARNETSRVSQPPEHRSRVIAWENADGSNTNVEEAEFIAIAPYASKAPLETWILPRQHQSHFGHPSNEAILARLLHRVLERLSEVAKDPHYVLVLQNAPLPRDNGSKEYAHYHWRIVIEPQKLAIPAGYEHLTGIWSNVVQPEDAADALSCSFETPNPVAIHIKGNQ